MVVEMVCQYKMLWFFNFFLTVCTASVSSQMVKKGISMNELVIRGKAAFMKFHAHYNQKSESQKKACFEVLLHHQFIVCKFYIDG